jgi:Type II secretory pathway, component PulD
VVVKDNETIVIGGLIQDTEDNTIQKVPLLGDIPGLGWFFKTTTKTRKKTNLLIMLTPQVVKDARDLASITESQKGKFTEAAKEFGPLNVQNEISGKATKPVSQGQESRP